MTHDQFKALLQSLNSGLGHINESINDLNQGTGPTVHYLAENTYSVELKHWQIDLLCLTQLCSSFLKYNLDMDYDEMKRRVSKAHDLFEIIKIERMTRELMEAQPEGDF